jgi:pimeloyl-ACP methyl ester carboxylesterase
MSRRTALRNAALVALAGAGAWEVQRRIDARRVAADPETAELQRQLHGRVVTARSADGTALHAEVFGREDAPTIVLVHGWTCSLDFWHYQVRDLSREFRVVAYDQRGHGRSEPPRGGAYTDAALADDLEAILAATVPAGERCVVAGHSMGGMAIVVWAGRHAGEVPTRLAAAALVSTGMGDFLEHLLVLRPRRGSRLYDALAPRLAASSLPLPRSSTPLTHRALRYVALSPKARPSAVAFTERMLLACPAPSRAGFGRFFSTLDLSTSVPKLDVPAVVMVGELDKLTPPWHARKLAQSLPQVEAVVEIPEVGHQAPLEAHEVVTERLRDLARRHLAAPVRTEVAPAQAG